MTLEEAIALVLEEGMRTEPVPDNAMAMLLHRRIEPSDKHINTLIEALRVIQDGLKEQSFLSRDLTAALWILGVEANTIVSKVSEEDDEVPSVAFHQIEDLVTAVESVFWNDWFVEDMRRAKMATALLEKQDVKEWDVPTAGGAKGGAMPPEYHWTVEAFNIAYDAGAFGPEKRLELIQGRIVEIMGQGPRHSTLASVIADMLREAAGKRFAVREEKPVQIAADSQPIPDVLVLKGRQTDYNDHQPRPEEVALIVEVSVTTVEYDLGKKAEQYAQVGISEYWVIVETDNAVVVHRGPSAEGYKSVTLLLGNSMLSPLALPDVTWTINDLLGRGEAQ